MPKSSSSTLVPPASPKQKKATRHIPLDSPKMVRVLDHLHQSRLARIELNRLGWTVYQLAEKADIHPNTAYRFLGQADGWAEGATKDPKSTTLRKVFEALGWTLQLVRGAR